MFDNYQQRYAKKCLAYAVGCESNFQSFQDDLMMKVTASGNMECLDFLFDQNFEWPVKSCAYVEIWIL